MQKFTRVLGCVLLILGLSSMTWAFPTQIHNSGEYMFTVTGNDPSSPGKDFSRVEALIEQWFLKEKNEKISIDLDFYAKVDAPAHSTTEGNGTLNLSFDWTRQSGVWNTGPTGDTIDFYSVKAGNQYAMYWVDPTSSFGFWSTEDLRVGNFGFNGKKNMMGNIPGISHLSAWKIANGGSQPPPPQYTAVPEPSTVLLLGVGMLSLVGLGRKRIRK